MKKILRKFIYLILFLTLLYLLFVISVHVGFRLKVKYIENRGCTQYNLTTNEMCMLNHSMNIYAEGIPFTTSSNLPMCGLYFENVYNYRKIFYKLIAGDLTEKKVDKLNSYLWSLSEDHEGYQLASQYGFSADEPISEKWVLAHPKETCKIISTDFDLELALRRCGGTYEEE